jgi:hypothetical protein
MAGEKRGFRTALLVVGVAVVAGLIARGGHGTDHPGPATAASGRPAATASASPSPSGGTYDPADYARQVRTRAAQAGVDPQLVMAILYNESYKPHDPALERQWQQLKPDAAFGIANMHRAAFEDTRQNRDFADRKWEELPDDRDLAVEAASWYLHDLGTQLPAHWSSSLSRDELLALGYNAGSGNMLAFARGATLGAQSRSYLDSLHQNWPKAAAALGG